MEEWIWWGLVIVVFTLLITGVAFWCRFNDLKDELECCKRKCKRLNGIISEETDTILQQSEELDRQKQLLSEKSSLIYKLRGEVQQITKSLAKAEATVLRLCKEDAQRSQKLDEFDEWARDVATVVAKRPKSDDWDDPV